MHTTSAQNFAASCTASLVICSSDAAALERCSLQRSRPSGAAGRRISPDEIQAAIRAYKTELRNAEALVFGLEFAARNDELKRARAPLRRLSGHFDHRKWEREFLQLMATLEKT